MTLGDAVANGQHPKTWTYQFLGGYRAYFSIVSRKHPALSGCDGMAYDFGSKDHPRRPLGEKEARVYYAADMDCVRFIHVLGHEMLHTVVEYLGARTADLIEEWGLNTKDAKG